MAYTNLNSVKLSLGIATNNTVYDALLSQFIDQSTNIINEWIGRDLTQRTITEYMKGNGRQELVLNQRPVTLISKTATLNSTTTVTCDTSGLLVGMPVCGTNPTPVNAPDGPAIVPGATIASIGTGSITLSQTANATGSQTLWFGVQIWVDELGYWGQAEGAFPTQTALTPGVDFGLDLDTSSTTSRSGIIYSINEWWPIPSNYTPGIITPVIGPADGNMKVTYTVGYNPVPSQIQLAANLLIAKMRQVSAFGQALDSESVKDYSYSLANGSGGIGLMTPEVTSLLAKYINVAV